MWERTLQDLIRGLRANKADEAKFIATAVEEIRREVKSDDMELKAGAVLKLTYLDMLGYDMTWASFNVVEVMSSPKFHLKSVGYLAAVQSFDQETDVLMLTTNLLKKDLASSPADIGVTLNGISHIATHDLGRDLAPELVKMLNHSRSHIRKRAVAALYKVMAKYPDIVPQGVARLEERLEDTDPAVVATTVNVLCELARRKPRDYLSLAPALFHLMQTSSNNWMLIKIIKLFGSMSPHEPRLVKKLQPPITDLISTTSAISLLYECVHTCIIGGMLRGSSGDSLAQTCVSKLANFIEDSDQNLKYIALLAMVKIVPSHPHLVAAYQDTILASVSDQDISIRMRALDLVTAMVNRHNLQSIVQQVLSHLVSEDSSSTPSAVQSLSQHLVPSTNAKIGVPPSQSEAYRLILSQRILVMCSQDTYENISNFEWYLSVLVDLAHVAKVDIGGQIRDQLLDVVGRVRAARRYAVNLMYTLLLDESMLQNAQDEGSCTEVLWAAAWICGEYCSELADPKKLLPRLMSSDVARLAPEITAVYISAATKVFGYWATDIAQQWTDDALPEVKSVVDMVLHALDIFVHSANLEVQERAANALQLFSFIRADLGSHRPHVPDSTFGELNSSFATPEIRFPKSMYLIHPLFDTYQLNPVNVQAQNSVPIPDGLDLDVWFISPPKAVLDEVVKVRKIKKGKGKDTSAMKSTLKKQGKATDGLLHEDMLVPSESETAEQRIAREKAKAERLSRLKDDPYYIMDRRSPVTLDDVDSIPVVRLEGMPFIAEPAEPPMPSLRDVPEVSSEAFVIEKYGEMPEGVILAPVSCPPSVSNGISTPPVTLTSFPEYDVPDSDTRTPTPTPIKVTRTKKKTVGKKKRITLADSGV